MELLLILIYVSFCYVIFKLFKIPVNQWSLSTAAFGGIVGIALLLLAMNYNHPFTKNARIYFSVTPLFPSVRGRRPGMYVLPVPFRPAMVFVNTDPQDKALGAAFQQNSLQRVKPGDEAEVAFDAVPGRVFKGKVRLILDAIATGQIQATGTLTDFGALTNEGRALAIIDVEEDLSLYQIPLGAAGQVAIYTEHIHHLALLRKILLRMRSWENYVFLEGH